MCESYLTPYKIVNAGVAGGITGLLIGLYEKKSLKIALRSDIHRYTDIVACFGIFFIINQN